ncbi:hypothetical protein SEETMRM10961_2935 [Salmonella enterica subsp. enterica serovar Typhimurium]|nr:hypothetical protein SEETMRM10961_2935 [Salmonella enterica subsp. enterica serovar Typhimurium]
MGAIAMGAIIKELL